MPLNQKMKYFYMLKRRLFFIASLFFAIQPSIYAGEIMCKDLKPFNNLDELLYQLYVNLDSDCLFNMPMEELEEIWAIRVFSRDLIKANPAYYSLNDSYYFYNKPYKTDKDSFYLEIFRDIKNSNIFEIHITKEYFEKHATLFPDGNYPKLLPAPIKEPYMQESMPIPLGRPVSIPKIPVRTTVRGINTLDHYSYYWLSSDRMRKISLTGNYGVTGIIMKKYYSSLSQ